MPYRIGIDAGSKTIKLVVVDENGTIVNYTYWRHRSNIRKTLSRMLEDFVERYGNFEGPVAVTGSAGIALADMLDLPFVQEVIATTDAVQNLYPQADAIVELGGEDAKVVYLSGKREQRMNATCAGGTGGFIDTMASMLGVRAAEMNQLALGAKHDYPIASRCAVFAQTDVRPLLAAGVSKEDIAASALQAVVRQTLGGLACGRPLRGTIVFLGGPFAYIPELSRRFRMALGLDEQTGIRPENAHLFTAYGAALAAGKAQAENPRIVTSLSLLYQTVLANDIPQDKLMHLPPLFENDAERRAFAERHAAERMPRERIFNCSGPLYLGFDAGSTTCKYALLDDAGNLVYSGYRTSDGNTLETALVMLSELYRTIPAGARVYIAQSVVVGYGDEMLRRALRIDSDIVETTAHLRAAQHLRPDVSFVLDIGGQDMKAMWVKNGQIVDAILNEACSSGCGSFIEGTARSLNMTRQGFSTAALESKNPFDLGTKCTVFMTSRVRHAQKAGADPADIAAGIAYSVVQNALFRVIGRDKSADMGEVVVVQGGAFKSDAVLRAFEKVSGVEAVRPDTAHLMGAIGAALVARDRAHDTARRAGGNVRVASRILGPDELEDLVPRYATLQCDGCANACTLSVVDFGDGRHFVSGGRCSRGQDIAKRRIAETGMDALAGKGASLPRMRKHRKPRNRIEASFNPLINATRDSIEAASAKAGAKGASPSASRRQSAPEAPQPRKQIRIVAPRHAAAAKRPPANVLANELAEFAKYGAFPGKKDRAATKVGILVDHAGYEAMPFWYTFFMYLGFAIVAPPTVCAEPAEDTCLPLSIARRRFDAFLEAGADFVLVPRFRHGALCQAAETFAGELVEQSGYDRIVSPVLKSLRPEEIPHCEEDLAAIHAMLSKMAPSDPPTYERMLDACRLAFNQQLEFEKRLYHGVDNAMIGLKGQTGQSGLVVAYRPCHMAPELLGPLQESLAQTNRVLLAAQSLEHYIAQEGNRTASIDPSDSGRRALSALRTEAAWDASTRTMSFFDFVSGYPALGLVRTHSACCDFDEELGDVLAGLPDAGAGSGSPIDIEALSDRAALERAVEAAVEAADASQSIEARQSRDGKTALHDGEPGDVPDSAEGDVRIVMSDPSHERFDDAPNAVAFEQDYIASLRCVPATRRPDIVVGLPETLSAYEQTPFWHTLLCELGYGIAVPKRTASAAERSAAAESVPSESVCEPAKTTHERLYNLRAAGATAVLLPRYERLSRCPVMCGYTDALADNVDFLQSGEVHVVAPALRSTNPDKFAADEAQATAIFEALRALENESNDCQATHFRESASGTPEPLCENESLDSHSTHSTHSAGVTQASTQPPALTRAEFDRALAAALEAYDAFRRAVAERTREALDWIGADERRGGIVVAGRPYHIDPTLMHGIDGVIQKLGFAVIPALGIADLAAKTGVKAAWKPAKHLLKTASFVIGNPALDMVVLQSFGCGYDAISSGDVRELLTGAGRTFTSLKIDEIVDTAHIRIRLRTMAEAIEARRRREAQAEAESRHGRTDAHGIESSEATADVSGTHGANARAIGSSDAETPSASSLATETPGAASLFSEGISATDLETARNSVPADICFTAAATCAHAINLGRSHDDVFARGLAIPEICKSCMVDALPHLVERATGSRPGVAWLEHGDPTLAPLAPAADAQAARPEPTCRIGIVGNPLLCFDPYMNENLERLLREIGAEPVWPDPANLYVDDVRYLDQLDAFARDCVDAVLYLQSFGCLKGHVQARGAANSIAERYPNMPVTILDYDPESSALNRENRIRLAVSAVQARE